MELSLKNIGLVEDSTIKLEGLTVLTGENNCGKTTVGKVLYCLLESFYDIDNKYQRAREGYLRKKVEEVMSLLYRYSFDIRRSYRIHNDFGIDFSKEGYSLDVFEEFIAKISEKEFIERFFGRGEEDISETRKHEIYLNWRQRAKEICMTAKNLLYAKDAFYGYVEDTLNNYLNVVFNSQVKSIKYNRQISEIKLVDVDLNVKLRTSNGNHFKLSDWNGFYSVAKRKCIFIDNPYILDNLNNFRRIAMPGYMRTDMGEENDGLASVNRYMLPGTDLLRMLYARNNNANYFEDREHAIKLTQIINLVNRVLPGEFVSNEKGLFYVANNKKLNISNLATGSKMFSIIKMLIINGKIDENTFLVLDEPESHLHPDWINKLAEILVVLSKEVGLQILLTTHSPNFLMAIEAFTKKYDARETTNFYHAVKKEDNYRVEYVKDESKIAQKERVIMKYLWLLIKFNEACRVIKEELLQIDYQLKINEKILKLEINCGKNK